MNTDYSLKSSQYELARLTDIVKKGLSPLFKYLTLTSEQNDLNGNISLLFKNKEATGEILCGDKHVFSIKCPVDQFKAGMKATETFNNPYFEHFMKKWCQKFAEDIYPLITQKKDIRQKNCTFVYQREELDEERKNGPGPGKSMRAFHPLFEPEMFVLFESYGISKLLADMVVKEYIEEKDSTIFYYISQFIVDLPSTEKELIPYFVPWLENFYDTLFEGFIENLILSGKYEDLKNNLLDSLELQNLSYIDRELISIENGEIFDLSLTKPHMSLEERVKPENLKILVNRYYAQLTKDWSKL